MAQNLFWLKRTYKPHENNEICSQCFQVRCVASSSNSGHVVSSRVLSRMPPWFHTVLLILGGAPTRPVAHSIQFSFGVAHPFSCIPWRDPLCSWLVCFWSRRAPGVVAIFRGFIPDSSWPFYLDIVLCSSFSLVCEPVYYNKLVHLSCKMHL